MKRTLRNRRGGFVMMEVIVAMTLLALIFTPLAAMVFKITSRNHRTVGNTYRNAIAMREVNYLEALPYDSLSEGTDTTVVTARPYPYTSTVIIDEYYSHWQLKAKLVTLVITPANPFYKADTMRFVRSSANTRTAFIDDNQ